MSIAGFQKMTEAEATAMVAFIGDALEQKPGAALGVLWLNGDKFQIGASTLHTRPAGIGGIMATWDGKGKLRICGRRQELELTLVPL